MGEFDQDRFLGFAFLGTEKEGARVVAPGGWSQSLGGGMGRLLCFSRR
jgi:hypothetical protein